MYNSELKGKFSGRLDKAIHSLIESLRVKLLNRLGSLQRGKVTTKLILLRKTHKTAEATEKDNKYLYKQTDETSWIVTLSSQEGGTYKCTAHALPLDHKCNETFVTYVYIK